MEGKLKRASLDFANAFEGTGDRTSKDLQFATTAEGQTGFTVTGTNKDVTVTTGSSDTATVKVKCFDYEAFGKIKVEFTPDGYDDSNNRQGGGRRTGVQFCLEEKENTARESAIQRVIDYYNSLARNPPKCAMRLTNSCSDRIEEINALVINLW